MKSCFFIGHHDAPLALQETLNMTVLRLITEHDVTEFIAGSYGNFDTMATMALQRAKMQHPNIHALRLLAYFPIDCSPVVPDWFDGTCYPEGLEMIPKRYSIVKANQAALDASDYLVAYVSHDGGNASKLLRRAENRQQKGLMRAFNLYST